MEGADPGVALIPQVIARGLDIVRGAAERDEHRVGVLGLVFAEEAVVAAREPETPAAK
jgi:hypothetical protein